MQKYTLGGDRLGSGKKMQVEMHGYERSTHDLSYIWRSTMAAGPLVPFMKEVGLPGDTFDINLDCIVKTHPTIGPLFGSYKTQLDIFMCPIRLYQGKLHNNAYNIGLNMANIKLPQLRLYAAPISADAAQNDIDNSQINPSCLLSYLGMRGVGNVDAGSPIRLRDFNGVPMLAYYDIYKNYYANKQEEIGAGIHTPKTAIVTTVTDLTFDGANTIGQFPASTPINITGDTTLAINYSGAEPKPEQIKIRVDGTWRGLYEYFYYYDNSLPGSLTTFSNTLYGIVDSWDYINPNDLPWEEPRVATFPLENIDKMREAILAHAVNNTAYQVGALNLPPYNWLALNTAPLDADDIPYLATQEGLMLKTYQSDLFNNWLSTDSIDGPNGISAVTAIDTTGGSFTVDTLNLATKVYKMLNRVLASGGSYQNWLEVNYDHKFFQQVESPVYMGGLIKELVFQEVVSNSATETAEDGSQPLGTLAGKGVMGDKRKGGSVTVKVDEPCYIMGIVSLTPRVDYSQGNHWDTHLQTMDDFHKPALDEIGFQELITEQMAWWTTWDNSGVFETRSAGKQPAWVNYMTNVNRTYGNFAIESNEMFMTLNRRYQENANAIEDLTTYIDPSKFNFIFAQTSIDAQNFWVQIGVDITARRKMSARIMPNL